MLPLAFSLSVPVESGMRRPLVIHHSMELTAHPLPAPSSLLLEAEQLLRECFPALVLLHSSRSPMVGINPAKADLPPQPVFVANVTLGGG